VVKLGGLKEAGLLVWGDVAGGYSASVVVERSHRFTCRRHGYAQRHTLRPDEGGHTLRPDGGRGEIVGQWSWKHDHEDIDSRKRAKLGGLNETGPLERGYVAADYHVLEIVDCSHSSSAEALAKA